MAQESNIQNSRGGKRIYKFCQYTKSINQAENKNKEGATSKYSSQRQNKIRIWSAPHTHTHKDFLRYVTIPQTIYYQLPS